MLAALLLPALAACWALSATSPDVASGSPGAPLGIPREPSIPRGKVVYGERCAACHVDRSTFGERSWRTGYSPADVTRMALGTEADHPAAVKSLERAWDATAYVWTLPDDRARIRRGERLALDAADVLRSHALSVALLHWNDVRDLRSASWVLNHDPRAVNDLMRRLAGERFNALTAGEKNDLVDYVFASYFQWPESW